MLHLMLCYCFMWFEHPVGPWAEEQRLSNDRCDTFKKIRLRCNGQLSRRGRKRHCQGCWRHVLQAWYQLQSVKGCVILKSARNVRWEGHTSHWGPRSAHVSASSIFQLTLQVLRLLRAEMPESFLAEVWFSFQSLGQISCSMKLE